MNVFPGNQYPKHQQRGALKLKPTGVKPSPSGNLGKPPRLTSGV